MKKLDFGGKGNIENSEVVTMGDFDFDKFPYKIKKNYYDYILVYEILEHLIFPDKVLEELWEAAKDKARIEIIVPHYTNKGAYSDMQHLHYFNEYCFTKLSKEKFKIIEIKITPTNMGRLFPRVIREKLALFINGLLSQIHIKLEIKK